VQKKDGYIKQRELLNNAKKVEKTSVQRNARNQACQIQKRDVAKENQNKPDETGIQRRQYDINDIKNTAMQI